MRFWMALDPRNYTAVLTMQSHLMPDIHITRHVSALQISAGKCDIIRLHRQWMRVEIKEAMVNELIKTAWSVRRRRGGR